MIVIGTKTQVPLSFGGSAQNWHFKISEGDNKKKVSGGFSGNLPSYAKAANKIFKV
jgi:hypothetical protein